MARIELRHCDIVIRDGSRGTAEVADASISDMDTTLEITDVDIVGDRTVVPVGCHFRVGSVDEKYLVTDQNSNKVFSITFTADDGTFTLTVNGEAIAAQDHDVTLAALETAIEGATAVGAGNVSVTGTAGSEYIVEFIGDFEGLTTPTLVVSADDLEESSTPVDATVTTVHPGAVTWEITFTPALDGDDLPVDMDEITFLPRELSIKIGDGDLRYTERDEYSYDLDRGELDTVRRADDVPMEVVSNFVYEHITTGTDEFIAPMDAIKQKGGAADWISSADDECEPYAVDILVVHTPPCGTSENEYTLFPDFRSEQREVNFRESNIQITGRCNVLEPVTWRGEETDEPV